MVIGVQLGVQNKATLDQHTLTTYTVLGIQNSETLHIYVI
jgi:hypothetical protein